jgi:hypothetical protein
LFHKIGLIVTAKTARRSTEMNNYEMNSPLTLSVRESSMYTGLSSTIIYAAIHSGNLAVIRSSEKALARIRIARAELDRYVRDAARVRT